MESSRNIRVLIIRLSEEIKQDEIPYFRGAVLARLGKDSCILFHNHDGAEKFRYAYPLIQYKRINRKAAIVCIEEGADTIGHFLTQCAEKDFMIGNRKVKMEIEAVQPTKTLVQIWEEPLRYNVRKWLPLNKENYKRYTEAESITERIAILENILKGNLLSMCKGLGISLSKQIEISIIDVSNQKLVRHKDIKLMSFDVEFKTNISIPDFVGIGKNASLGYGMVTRKRIAKQKNTEE